MNYRNLGNRGLRVSAIGLGCMGMSHAYGAPAGHREMAELLAKAVELGYDFFDTAEVYGTPDNPHDNEELLGNALKPYRNKVVIATKFGIRFDKESGRVPYPLIPDSRPETIRRSVEGSLRRLRTDYIDLYYQHRPDPNVPIEVVAGTVQELIREGKVLYWGLSEASEADIRRANAICPLSAVQDRYSMMARWHEALFPTLEELGISLVAFSPLANGLLSDRYTADSRFEAGTDYRVGMPQFQPDSYAQKPRTAGTHPPHRRREERHTRTNFPRVDALQEAVDSPHSRHTQARPLAGERWSCGHCIIGRGSETDRPSVGCDADVRRFWWNKIKA